MDKKKEKMTPERRYELACLILGGVVLGGALGCILRPNEWTFAVIPLLGVCLTALLWCAAARLWLCRDKQRLLAKSFTRPVRFALAVPAWVWLPFWRPWCICAVRLPLRRGPTARGRWRWHSFCAWAWRRCAYVFFFI